MKARNHKPSLVAAAVVVNHQGQVFLGKAPKFRSAWIAPGGHIEKSETPQKAIRRELKEELGVNAKKLVYLQFHKWFSKEYKKEGALFHCHNFVAFIDQSQSVSINEEYEEFVFLDLNQAMHLQNLHPTAELILGYYKQYLQKQH